MASFLISLTFLICIFVNIVDYKVTEKSFAFATKRNAPFFFASASGNIHELKIILGILQAYTRPIDGTNVVQIFKEAMKLGKKFKESPPTDFVSDVMNFLEEVNFVHFFPHRILEGLEIHEVMRNL
jgi:Rab-like protein 2